ncbi:MAG: ClbS/DfsB family four-helix bundle protein [Clostridiales bacterium]|nr:ClbS/DfsB family four-helix bundle protein [Clostridiales bacterium]
MARPTTKADLLEAANEQFTKLFALIDSMSDEEQKATFLFEDRDRNIRDILIHLYEWHHLLLHWVNANQKGISAPFLLEPYNWRTYPQMNIDFWEKHQQTPYQDSKAMVQQSHKDVIKLIDTFSNEELFSKKQFPWTGTTTLGSYCVSATSSHYNWAMKKIKNHIKTYKH